ncbi:MAG: histidinol-phosphate transaminase [Candidatus Melainabacteria bacterium]|nr:histidinol-phosphate transaminase [Candidatus Melainabacteria bacterium]
MAEQNFVDFSVTPSHPRRLVPAHIQSLTPYLPGRPPWQLQKELGIDHFINLASNENPLGPPESALRAMTRAFPEVNRYPESGGLLLRESLAEHYRVKLNNVVIGSGSESIMANIIRAFLHGDDEVLTSEGTFIGLYVLVHAHGVALKMVPLKNYRFDLEAMACAITDKTKIIYLCNPNNPTGTIFTREEFDAFIAKVPEHVLVILDEAYHEFTMGLPEFPDSMSYRYDNVLTLRTFSKVYGMAGLRLGYGLGHDYLIGFVNRIKLPFEPNSLAQAAGLAALADTDFLERSLKNNLIGRSMLADEFSRLGLRYVPSHTNFIMVDFGSKQKVAALHQELLKQGIAIRPLHAFGLPHCLRVTVGLPAENEALINAMYRLVD